MEFNEYCKYISDTLSQINHEEIERLISFLKKAYLNGNTVFIVGNGGSAANASHFAEDLSKGTTVKNSQTKRIKAFSLTDNVPYLTAVANDDGYDRIYEQQLITFAAKGDILIAISGSGNSPNIIRAVEWGNDNGLITFGITGFDGGKLKQINQHSIHVPLDDMFTAESIHLVLAHYVVLRFKDIIGKLMSVELLD